MKITIITLIGVLLSVVESAVFQSLQAHDDFEFDRYTVINSYPVDQPPFLHTKQFKK